MSSLMNVNIPLVVRIDEILNLPGNNSNHLFPNYLIHISSSEVTQRALLDSYLAERVLSGEIHVGCFIRLIDYIRRRIEYEETFVVLNFEIVAQNPNRAMVGYPDEDASIDQFSSWAIVAYECDRIDSIRNIIGLVAWVDPCLYDLRKNGRVTGKRILKLIDQYGGIVELSLWGRELCTGFDTIMRTTKRVTNKYPVIGVQAGRVTDSDKLEITCPTKLSLNPVSPQTDALHAKYPLGRISENKLSRLIPTREDKISGLMYMNVKPEELVDERRKTVAQIMNGELGGTDKPDWVTVRASMITVDEDICFFGTCPLKIGNKQCGKLVQESREGRWFCDACKQEFEDCSSYAFALLGEIEDETGSVGVIAFQEGGEEILGCSAKELYMLKNEKPDNHRFTEKLTNRLYLQFLLTVKIKETVINGVRRVVITVAMADAVD